MAQALPHSIMYTAGQQVHYLPQYYAPSYPQFVQSPFPDRTLKPERRRPKYTRSKTGCLTCRRKKVKCDEFKPKCQRCQNSSLECSWPKMVPPKKKGVVKKRSSTALDQDSANTSEAGTSSVSPIACGSAEGIPQPKVEDEDSYKISLSPHLAYTVGDVLRGHSHDNIKSGAQLHTALGSLSGIGSRQHSSSDTLDVHFDTSTGGPGEGALGLTLNQIDIVNASHTRPPSPNDFLGSQSSSAGYAQCSPALRYRNSLGCLNVAALPASSTSNSFSLNGMPVLRRAASTGSRPSTTSSVGNVHLTSHYDVLHRPASANGVSTGGAGIHGDPLLGFSPFSFQAATIPRLDSSLDPPTSMSAYHSSGPNTPISHTAIGASVSRPSTANSMNGAAQSVSPFMRHVGVSSVHAAALAAAHAQADDLRWRGSPMLGHTSLGHPAGNAPPVTGAIDGYFTPGLTHSPTDTTHHSRPHSPTWNY